MPNTRLAGGGYQCFDECVCVCVRVCACECRGRGVVLRSQGEGCKQNASLIPKLFIFPPVSAESLYNVENRCNNYTRFQLMHKGNSSR